VKVSGRRVCRRRGNRSTRCPTLHVGQCGCESERTHSDADSESPAATCEEQSAQQGHGDLLCGANLVYPAHAKIQTVRRIARVEQTHHAGRGLLSCLPD